MNEAAVEANRVNGKKGGRPPKAFWPDSKKITRRFLDACPEAFSVIVHEMRTSDNPAVRLQAAKEILDRGIGRATHRLEPGTGGILNQLVVYTGVPEPDPGSVPDNDIIIGGEPVDEEDRFLIEGEAVKDADD